jgi:hypothetical protein
MSDADGIFTVDPDEAFEVLPEGDYTFYITNAEKKKKEGGEYAYVEVTFTVAEGQYEGWTATDRLTENPAARWRLARLVKAVGLARPGEAGERQFTCESLKGCVVDGKITHEEFKGMKMARPDKYTMHDSVQKRLEGETGGTAAVATEVSATAPATAAPAAQAASAPAAPAAPKKTPPPARPQTKVKV